MLTTDQQNESLLQDSSHAQALSSASSASSVHLLPTTGSAADAACEITQAITRTFRMAASDWNNTYDRIRVLPTELRFVCWSFLSPSDMLRIPSVCRSWRELSLSCPLLWTNLRLSGSRGDHDHIFSLSAGLPLHVDIWDCLPADAYRVNQCLSDHAARLQSLRISLSGDIRLDNPDGDLLFLYPVPKLRSFTLQTSRRTGDWRVSWTLFNDHAPELRSVTLSNVALPGGCEAFSQLTHLRIENNCGPLGHIYGVAPMLQELELVDVHLSRTLTTVLAASPLSKVSFLVHEPPFSVLRDRGYLALPQLVVSVQSKTARLSTSATDCPPEYRGTLTISASGRSALVLRHPRGSAAFIATDPWPAEVCSLLRGGAHFHTLERLVLPAALNLASDPCFLAFPALLTLVLLYHHAPLEPDIPCWRLAAPLLSRIEVSRDSQAEHAGDVSVDQCHIACFIEERVSCDAPAALEVHVDCAGGVRLECTHLDSGLDRPRACVRNLVLSQ